MKLKLNILIALLIANQVTAHTPISTTSGGCISLPVNSLTFEFVFPNQGVNIGGVARKRLENGDIGVVLGAVQSGDFNNISGEVAFLRLRDSFVGTLPASRLVLNKKGFYCDEITHENTEVQSK